MICSVAKQRDTGVRCLGANLMFATRLEPQPQLGDDVPAARELEFLDYFVVVIASTASSPALLASVSVMTN